MNPWVPRLVCVFAIALLSPPAEAHRRNFTATYDWYTAAKNEKELELWWTQAQGGEADFWLEFEYGVTPRWTVAPYLLTKSEHGGKWEVEGWKLEQRYRFGEFSARRLLPAVYLEVVKEEDEPYELEFKGITSYVSGGRIWSLNLIAEKELEHHRAVEWGYATGVARRPFASGLWLGAEFFGNLTKDEHFGGPVLGYSFSSGDHLLLTGGLGLNHRSAGQIRLLFEREWF
jgi:hypothetical protein